MDDLKSDLELVLQQETIDLLCKYWSRAADRKTVNAYSSLQGMMNMMGHFLINYSFCYTEDVVFLMGVSGWRMEDDLL